MMIWYNLLVTYCILRNFQGKQNDRNCFRVYLTTYCHDSIYVGIQLVSLHCSGLQSSNKHRIWWDTHTIS